MEIEKIKQVISDYDALREKIIDAACKKIKFKSDWIKRETIWFENEGIGVTIYDYEGFDYDCFLSWKEIKWITSD